MVSPRSDFRITGKRAQPDKKELYATDAVQSPHGRGRNPPDQDSEDAPDERERDRQIDRIYAEWRRLARQRVADCAR
jgi:hypothetical protein